MKKPSAYLDFLRTQANARYICSVCEGGVLLAASGLLDGHLMTTHWAFIPCLSNYKVKVARVGEVAADGERADSLRLALEDVAAAGEHRDLRALLGERLGCREA